MRKLATYEGIVENGKVKLPADAGIPEKTRVFVLIPTIEIQSGSNIASPRLVNPEQAKDFEKQIVEDTNDATL